MDNLLVRDVVDYYNRQYREKYDLNLSFTLNIINEAVNSTLAQTIDPLENCRRYLLFTDNDWIDFLHTKSNFFSKFNCTSATCLINHLNNAISKFKLQRDEILTTNVLNVKNPTYVSYYVLIKSSTATNIKQILQMLIFILNK